MRRYEGSEINDILPMRYPYMFLNSLCVEEKEYAEAVIHLKENDWFFQCHFPGNPIFPGFLLLESLGQTLLSTFIRETEPSEGQVPLMTEVKDIHFGGFCVPGDKVIIRADLKRFKYGTAKGIVVAYKNEITEAEVLARAEFLFMMPKLYRITEEG